MEINPYTKFLRPANVQITCTDDSMEEDGDDVDTGDDPDEDNDDGDDNGSGKCTYDSSLYVHSLVDQCWGYCGSASEV